MDKLKIFIQLIREISLIQRIFGWSKIKFASYEAYEEFKKLENQIGKLEIVKKELESINKLYNLNEINLMELKTEIKFLREKNEELIKENQNYKSKDQQKEIEYSKKMVEFNQAQKNLTEAREKVFNDAIEKENLKLEKMKNQWQEHERITGEIIECIGPEVFSFKEILLKILQSINKKRILFPLPLSLAKINARLFELMPNPLLTLDQLKLLKYDNIKSGLYKTNFDLGFKTNKLFDDEINKYSYNWRSGGQFATEERLNK